MPKDHNAVYVDHRVTDNHCNQAAYPADDNNIPDIIEIDCFETLSNITLSHKIYGRGSDDQLIAKAAELARLNPVANTMHMPTKVRAYIADMLPEVLATRRI